ncbi:MAG: hypothetical protein E6Q45_05205 [Flavobacterium sp.]|nr:MAG: hypothetical protein E6Q45_05205 [Flavobacterium sp.]
MTTLTLNINEKTEKGKALLAFLKAFYEEKEVIQIVEEPKSPYNKAFVAKIQKARKEIKEGKTIAIETDSIWESIE